MAFYILFFIALGLAMDAFAVSVSCGFTCTQHRMKNAVKTGIFFGGFQGIMPVLGYFSGYYFRDLISAVDHWIAFALLSLIGVKMIYESVQPGTCNAERDYSNMRILLLLAIATSIDAFAIGLSFALLGIDIAYPAIIIGIVTFIMTLAGFAVGNRIGVHLGKWAERIGGAVLIGIGIKILMEHML